MVTYFFVRHTVSIVASPGTIISCHAKKKKANKKKVAGEKWPKTWSAISLWVQCSLKCLITSPACLMEIRWCVAQKCVCSCFGVSPQMLKSSISTSCQPLVCCSCSGLAANDCASCCVASLGPPWPPTGCDGSWSACTYRRWPRGFCKSVSCRWDSAAGSYACGSGPGCSGSPRRCSATTCHGRWSWAWGARACTGQSTPVPWRAWRCGKIRRWCSGWNAAPGSSALRHLGLRAEKRTLLVNLFRELKFYTAALYLHPHIFGNTRAEKCNTSPASDQFLNLTQGPIIS